MSCNINNFSNKQTITTDSGSIYRAEFSKSMKFHKNLSQTHKNMGLKEMYKEMYGQGQCMPPAINFFVKIGKFRVPHICELATGSYESSHICLILHDNLSSEVLLFV